MQADRAVRSKKTLCGIAASAVMRTCCVILLVGFLAQAGLVSAHSHSSQTAIAEVALVSGTSGELSDRGEGQESPDSADFCVFCWEAASAGKYLQPELDAVSLPEFATIRIARPVVSDFGLGKNAHGWLGRAPPR